MSIAGKMAPSEAKGIPAASDRPWSAGFRTLAEEYDYQVEDIVGTVPAELRGTLFHNGPGRNDIDGRWFSHWFDGDGMVTAFRFDNAGIRFKSRYVRTRSYCDERKLGRIAHRGFGKMRPGGILANAFRLPENVANTSLMRCGRKLLALWEGGPPTSLDPASLETLGLEDFGGKVEAFSAHPKRDPRTGETFNFGIDYGRRTTLTPYRIGLGGELAPYPALTLPYPVMNHDFALTARYMVFCLGPLLVHPLKMMLGLASFDDALQWDGTRPTRILLVPRDRSHEPQWLETDAFFHFHFANGFDDGDAVVLDLAQYPDYRTIGEALRNYWRSDWPAQGMAKLTRLRIDPSSGRAEREYKAAGNAHEFPTIDPRRVGGQHRYVYMLANPTDRPRGLQQLVTRVDMETGKSVSHDFGPSGYPGEPLFIPRGDGEENDGFVATIVFDAAVRRSEIVCLDTQDLAARPLFTARLPHHLPFALHGLFVPEGS